MTGVLMRKRTLAQTQVHAGYHLVKMKADVGGMLLHTKDCQRVPANHRS